jgi:K+-sensing histidine kinase KdpD
MSLTDFVTLATRVIYFVLGVLTVVSAVRYRDRPRTDTALMFAAMTVIVIAQQYAVVSGALPQWAGRLTSILLMAHPYLLLRLVEHFRSVPKWLHWAVLAGLIASAAALVVAAPLPPAASLALVAYFVSVEVYAAVAFVRGAMASGGVTNRRMWLAAAGSGMIAVVIFLAGVTVINSGLAQAIQIPALLASILSGIFYYLAFATPLWLRRSWQLQELHRFLTGAAHRPAAERTAQALPYLVQSVSRIVAARAVAASLWDDSAGQLTVRASTDTVLSGTFSHEEGAVGRAWQTGRPTVARTRVQMAPQSLRLAEKLGAAAVLAAPIASADRRWGVLAAFLSLSPLFPADDGELLTLLGEQTALALDQAALLEEQQRLVGALKTRTAQLETANKELEAFSYSISHDLRAPLRHIQGFTDLLLKNGSSESARRPQLLRIADAATRMGRLIDNLLAFSRLARQNMENLPVDLNRLVDQARRDLQADQAGRAVQWRVGSLPPVRGDPDMLYLVLLNVLSNALKYTRPRAASQIEIDCLPEANGEAVIYVRDNGVGFDMQYASKLFGVFQRLHHAEEFEGEGIGLANVRRIIQRHGGRTWAEGAPDQGATIYFSLPLAGRAPGPAAQETSAA